MNFPKNINLIKKKSYLMYDKIKYVTQKKRREGDNMAAVMVRGPCSTKRVTCRQYTLLEEGECE